MPFAVSKGHLEVSRRPDLARVDRDPETKPNKEEATTVASSHEQIKCPAAGDRTAKQPGLLLRWITETGSKHKITGRSPGRHDTMLRKVG